MSFAVVGTGLAIGGGAMLAGEVFGPDAPAAPDFKGAAEAESAANLALWDKSLDASRYDVTTPLGSLEWTETPGEEIFDQTSYDAAMADYYDALAAYESPTTTHTGLNWYEGMPEEGPEPRIEPIMPDRTDFTTMGDSSWSQAINLTPEAQAIYDKTLDMQGMTADIGLRANEQIADIFSDPFTLDDFETYDEQFYNDFLDRIETDIDRDWEAQQSQLYAAGHSAGDIGYQREQEAMERQLNDARIQARLASQDAALKDRQQIVKESLLERTQPINEYSAWRTGSQVQMPEFQSQPFIQPPQGPGYMDAADLQTQYNLGLYNADVMGTNQLMSGLFSLGAGGLAGGYF